MSVMEQKASSEDRAGLDHPPAADAPLDAVALLGLLGRQWRRLVTVPLAAGLLALGGSYLMTPVFTARTSLLPPQQQQSGAAAALASLGALSGLAAAAGVKTQADQFVALMQSETIQDRLIDRHKLMEVYRSEFRFQARRQLTDNTRISVGKKDGLIYVEVDDTSPQRAAALANEHVDELRRLMATLSISEAQQRRKFFETRLRETRTALAQAQQAMQASGFNEGVMRSEPGAAVENYARLKAEVTAAEARLASLRQAMADSSAQVQQQQAALATLRARLGTAERGFGGGAKEDYVARFREFKYQEALFDIFARQFELARLDESREGALIQVIDPAQQPEWKSRPKRAAMAVGAAAGALLLMVLGTVLRLLWSRRGSIA